MAVVRKTISLPAALAARLDAVSHERQKSVSEVVADALEKDLAPERRWRLPAPFLFDGPGDMSSRVDELLAETWADDIERHR